LANGNIFKGGLFTSNFVANFNKSWEHTLNICNMKMIGYQKAIYIGELIYSPLEMDTIVKLRSE